jgi:ubiquinone/menaquinone biosynthesis C-methylase UbiE
VTNNVGPQRWLFDLWSRFYDVPAVQRAFYRPVQDAVLGELRYVPARRILDVGCGTGIFTERLARELDAELVCGCDFCIGMLEQAVTRQRGGRWVLADAHHLPFSSGSVDVVVSTESFQWFADPDGALAEFHRVLSPSGRLLVEMINTRTTSMSLAASIEAALGHATGDQTPLRAGGLWRRPPAPNCPNWWHSPANRADRRDPRRLTRPPRQVADGSWRDAEGLLHL